MVRAVAPLPAACGENSFGARASDGFDDQRVEDDLARLVDIAEAAPVKIAEVRPHLLRRPTSTSSVVSLPAGAAARGDKLDPLGATPCSTSARAAPFERAQGVRKILARAASATPVSRIAFTSARPIP